MPSFAAVLQVDHYEVLQYRGPVFLTPCIVVASSQTLVEGPRCGCSQGSAILMLCENEQVKLTERVRERERDRERESPLTLSLSLSLSLSGWQDNYGSDGK